MIPIKPQRIFARIFARRTALNQTQLAFCSVCTGCGGVGPAPPGIGEPSAPVWFCSRQGLADGGYNRYIYITLHGCPPVKQGCCTGETTVDIARIGIFAFGAVFMSAA